MQKRVVYDIDVINSKSRTENEDYIFVLNNLMPI
jgi:hypothetical protein